MANGLVEGPTRSTVMVPLAAAMTGIVTFGAVLAGRAGWPGWLAAGLAALFAGAAIGMLGRFIPATRGIAGRQAVPQPQAEPVPPHCAERLAALEAQVSSLRHDLRGILAPAMLVGDRLTESPDPKVAKAGETVVRAVNRAADRLASTKGGPARPG